MLKADEHPLIRAAAARDLAHYVVWAHSPERVDEIMTALATATHDLDENTAYAAHSSLWYADAVRSGADKFVQIPERHRPDFDQALIQKYRPT